MKRVKHALPSVIDDDILEGSRTHASFELRRGVVLTRQLVFELVLLWEDEYIITSNKGHLKIEYGRQCPDEIQQELDKRVASHDRLDVIPSVESLIAPKDHSKWMKALCCVARYISCYFQTPVCHCIAGKNTVVKALTKELWGRELGMLLASNTLGEVKVFAQEDTVCLFIDVK